jgi:hypothetical protein
MSKKDVACVGYPLCVSGSPRCVSGAFPSFAAVEVAVACSVSLPTVVRSVSVVNGFLVAVCADGFTRRCKFFSAELVESLEAFVESASVVVFKAFGNWSVDNWFSEVEPNTASILHVSSDVCVFDHTKLPENEHDIFMAAIEYGLRRMRLTDDIGLDIKFNPHYEEDDNGTTMGWAKPIDQDAKDYLIMVSYNNNLRKAIDTLFHEMRHVAQWNAGIMDTFIKDKVGVVTKWKDKEYIRAITPYTTAPWEVDARKAAKIATDDFFNNLN